MSPTLRRRADIGWLAVRGPGADQLERIICEFEFQFKLFFERGRDRLHRKTRLHPDGRRPYPVPDALAASGGERVKNDVYGPRDL